MGGSAGKITGLVPPSRLAKEAAIPQPSTGSAHAYTDQVLELVTDGVAVLYPDGRLVPHNRAMLDLLARSAGHGATLTLDDLRLDPQDYSAMVGFLASDAVEHRAVVKMLSGERGVICGVAMQRQGDGAVLATFQDQTFMRSAAERLARLDRFHCFGRLADGLVHDLNNLLGAMLGMADQIGETAAADADLELLLSLRSGTRNGARLLQQIGKLMRRHGPDLERFSLVDAVADAVRMVHKSARLGGTEATCNCSAADPFVRGNPNALVHLLCELAARVIGTAQVLRLDVGQLVREPEHHNLPARQFGTVCLRVDVLPEELAELPSIMRGDGRGLLEHAADWQGDGTGLLAVVMGLVADGGFVETLAGATADAEGPPLGLCIGLPLVAAPGRRERGPGDPPLELPLECRHGDGRHA